MCKELMVRLNIMEKMGFQLSVERWVGLLNTTGEKIAGGSLSRCMGVAAEKSDVIGIVHLPTGRLA